jgi:hypothetical protein
MGERGGYNVLWEPTEMNKKEMVRKDSGPK